MRRWRIRGFELDAGTGEPLPGLRVTIYDNVLGLRNPLYTTWTDNKGMWEYTGKVDTDFVVHVEMPEMGGRHLAQQIYKSKWIHGLKPHRITSYRLPKARTQPGLGRTRPT